MPMLATVIGYLDKGWGREDRPWCSATGRVVIVLFTTAMVRCHGDIGSSNFGGASMKAQYCYRLLMHGCASYALFSLRHFMVLVIGEDLAA